MKIPPLDIGDIHVPFPLIQGGMGVRVSLARLAAAVANEGGIGTIASVGLGDIEASKTDFENVSRNALIHEIRRAKSMTDGPIAINILGVLSNARDLIRDVGPGRDQAHRFGRVPAPQAARDGRRRDGQAPPHHQLRPGRGPRSQDVGQTLCENGRRGHSRRAPGGRAFGILVRTAAGAREVLPFRSPP